MEKENEYGVYSKGDEKEDDTIDALVRTGELDHNYVCGQYEWESTLSFQNLSHLIRKVPEKMTATAYSKAPIFGNGGICQNSSVCCSGQAPTSSTAGYTTVFTNSTTAKISVGPLL